MKSDKKLLLEARMAIGAALTEIAHIKTSLKYIEEGLREKYQELVEREG